MDVLSTAVEMQIIWVEAAHFAQAIQVEDDKVARLQKHKTFTTSKPDSHVLLTCQIDGGRIDGEIAPLYSERGRPGIETRFVIGPLLLKHIYGLSDEGVRALGP